MNAYRQYNKLAGKLIGKKDGNKRQMLEYSGQRVKERVCRCLQGTQPRHIVLLLHNHKAWKNILLNMNISKHPTRYYSLFQQAQFQGCQVLK